MLADRHPPWLRMPPPLMYAAAFVAGLLLDRGLPWPARWLHTPLWAGIGWALIAAAAVLASVSIGYFRSARTTVIPHGQPSRLVSSGPYALSRNPMYVALTAAHCGGALVLARLWPLVLVLAPLLALQLAVIPFEERRLQATFGEAYEAYRRRVRRWL